MMRRIEIGLPTKNRPDCIPMMLQALRTQDYVHWDLTIVDDNDPPLLKDNLVVQRMLWLLEMEGHRWRILRGVRQGPHYAHNVTLVSAEHSWVLRIDDDLVPQPTFISTLVETIQHYEKALPVGAIGGVYPEVAAGDRTHHHMSDRVRASLPQFAPFESVEQRFLLPGEKARLVKALYSGMPSATRICHLLNATASTGTPPLASMATMPEATPLPLEAVSRTPAFSPPVARPPRRPRATSPRCSPCCPGPRAVRPTGRQTRRGRPGAARH